MMGTRARENGAGTTLVIGIRLLLVGLLGWIGCWIATQHPLWPWLQLSGTVLCFAVATTRPAWFAGMFPFLLVVGDAYPATGQLLFQEYDSLLLGAISGALLRTKQHTTLERAQAREWLPWILWAISVALGLALGWMALPATEWGDQLSLYFANTNSLRVAKGHAWGILFAVFLLTQRTTSESLTKNRQSFFKGVQCAALVVGIGVLLERLLFESIFDFSHEYRATGPFFSMHIGDHHLDAFIVLATPLAWVGIDRFQKSLACLWASTLTVLMLYAAIATMSRATIIIITVQMLAIVILKAWHESRATSLPRISWRGFFLVSACLGIVAVAALLGLRGPAIRERFTHSENDWNTRVEHWKKAVDPKHFTLQQIFLGHGLGTFPTFMAQSMELPIPPLRWRSDDGGKIEIRGGWPLYLERAQWPASHDSQSIAMRITHSDSDGTPTSIFASRSFKALLQSYESVEVAIAVPRDADDQQFEFVLPAPKISSNSPTQRIWRPETLSISMHGQGIAT
ncbi:MAG: O-antigen ligase family protein [Planctomycetota bacterium]|nr:O-antigen ligase family protein [Planctomycetota bacterium]